VEDDSIRRFADAIDNLQRVTSSEDIKDDFEGLLRKLRRYLFRLRAAPVPTSLDAIVPEELEGSITQYLKVSKEAFPSSVGESLEGVKKEFLTVYREEGYQPLLKALISYLSEEDIEEECVVLNETDLIPPTREAINQEGKVRGAKVIGYREARRTDRYGERLVVGNPSWYPDDMFEAPRAQLTRIFVFSWERGTDIEIGVDVDQSVKSSGPLPKVRKSGTDESYRGFDLEDIDPIMNWENIVAQQKGGDYGGQVMCRVFSFPRGYAAFIPTGKNRTVEVVELQEAGEAVVHRRKDVDKIEPGDYVLLRIEGGGSLVKEVANNLMGDRQEELRRMEKEWKSKLREEVEKKGDIEVAIKLLDLGGEKVNESNLRNWITDRVISPSSRDDMEAILRLLGMEERLERYWKGMQVIRECHRKAGREIRKALVERVSDAEVDELESEGIQKINLGDRGGGELGILRVEEMSPDEYEVPDYKVRTPFERDSTLS
jgi:hypothetical protein